MNTRTEAMHTHLKPTGRTACRSGRRNALLSGTCLHKARPWLLTSVLLLASALGPSGATAPERDRGSELLVKWKAGPSSAAAAAGNARIGGTVKRNFNAVGWQLVELPPGMTLDDGLEAYRKLDAVLLAEPDRAVPPPIRPEPEPADQADGAGNLPHGARLHGPAAGGVTPNDPLFAQQWHLRRIAATNAWAVTTGSAEVVVAIIDTGVDYTHPDLAPNMWRNSGETGLDAGGADKATNGVDDDENTAMWTMCMVPT